MKILFIYSLCDVQSPDKPLKTPQQIQFGISYISSFLKENGHDTKLVILSKIWGRKNREIIDSYLKKFPAELICFTAVNTEYRFIAETAKYIKNTYPRIYLLIGGPHVSLNPQGVLETFDALCIGEGENPTLELVSQIEKGIYPSGIANLWIKTADKIEKRMPREFFSDLDKLPFPDREMWKEWTQEHRHSQYSILLGRGCPFQCSYCCNHALKKLAGGNYVRFRSADNIIAEIKETTRIFPEKKEIYLEVESFGTYPEWALKLCAELERLNSTLEIPLSFRVNLRVTPNMQKDTLFAACKKSNVKTLNIGVESGSERIRSEILKRNYSNHDIISTVSLARKYGLKIAFFNMIGIPGEKLSDFRETVKINRRCLPEEHFTSIFFPYQGTDLYHLCKKEGLLKTPVDTSIERNKAVLDLPGFSKKQIQRSYLLFDYYVYKGYKPIYKIIDRIIVLTFASNFHLYSIYTRLRRSLLLKWLKKILREY